MGIMAPGSYSPGLQHLSKLPKRELLPVIRKTTTTTTTIIQSSGLALPIHSRFFPVSVGSSSTRKHCKQNHLSVRDWRTSPVGAPSVACSRQTHTLILNSIPLYRIYHILVHIHLAIYQSPVDILAELYNELFDYRDKIK